MLVLLINYKINNIKKLNNTIKNYILIISCSLFNPHNSSNDKLKWQATPYIKAVKTNVFPLS